MSGFTVLRDNRVLHFVPQGNDIVIANPSTTLRAGVDGGDPVDSGLDLLAIATIDKTRGRRA